jgi:hypothetical protein
MILKFAKRKEESSDGKAVAVEYRAEGVIDSHEAGVAPVVMTGYSWHQTKEEAAAELDRQMWQALKERHRGPFIVEHEGKKYLIEITTVEQLMNGTTEWVNTYKVLIRSGVHTMFKYLSPYDDNGITLYSSTEIFKRWITQGDNISKAVELV